MGRAHAGAAQYAGGVVKVVADSDTTRSAELARLLGTRAGTLDSILASGEVDVLHVCTPVPAHADVCRRALSAGIHVICEKPVTATAAELSELLALAEQKDLLLCPVHQFPFQRGAMSAAGSIASLGVIRHVIAEICTAGADGESQYDRGQLALDILPHPLSLSRMFGAQPLAGVEWNVASDEPGELTITGVGDHKVLTFILSTRGRPTTNSFRVIGDSGTATLDLFHGYAFVERLDVSRSSKLIRPFAASALQFGGALANGIHRLVEGETEFPGLRELVSRFYAAVLKGLPSPVSPDDAMDIAAARDAIASLTSASAGSRVL